MKRLLQRSRKAAIILAFSRPKAHGPRPKGTSLQPLLIATTNPGKVREIRRILEGTSVRLVTLADLSPIPEPEETGRTFADNARLKAGYYAAASGHVTVAEDSGLVIDALGGRPGVESARYPGATYPDRFANLYRELAAHPRPWRARFVCSLAVVKAQGPGPKAQASQLLFECEAQVEGEIAAEPRGAYGFGYDPFFFYPPLGRTTGELTDDEKIAISHRGQAFRQLKAWLDKLGPWA
jgi:XTP/dITP diphosphohydrolase